MLTNVTSLLEEYIKTIATPIIMANLKISITDGSRLGCTDMHLLNLADERSLVSELVFKSDLVALCDGVVTSRLEQKIRSAEKKLKQHYPNL